MGTGRPAPEPTCSKRAAPAAPNSRPRAPVAVPPSRGAGGGARARSGRGAGAIRAAPSVDRSRERRLRLAEQQAHAERALRTDVEQELRGRTRAARHDLAALHERVADLERELTRMRRAVDEAQHLVAAAHAGRIDAERRLEERPAAPPSPPPPAAPGRADPSRTGPTAGALPGRRRRTSAGRFATAPRASRRRDRAPPGGVDGGRPRHPVGGGYRADRRPRSRARRRPGRDRGAATAVDRAYAAIEVRPGRAAPAAQAGRPNRGRVARRDRLGCPGARGCPGSAAVPPPAAGTKRRARPPANPGRDWPPGQFRPAGPDPIS